MLKLSLALVALTMCSAALASDIAITVDDLPTHGGLPAGMSRQAVAEIFLRTFNENKVPQVYGFINAVGFEKDHSLRAILSAWTMAGHPLGNHTYSHLDLNLTDAATFIGDIEKNDAFLRQTSGTRFFRFPYLHEGNTLAKRTKVRESLKRMSYRVAPVSISFQDYAWNDPYLRCLTQKDGASIRWLKDSFIESAIAGLTYAEKLSLAIYGRQIPQILLLHIGAFEAEVAGELIAKLKLRGDSFITLEKAVSDAAYEEDPGLAFENGGFFFSQALKARKKTAEDYGLKNLDNFPAELSSICR
ncbi:MAG: polysaccharide deacetylase [Proteobacteria bacterium]|nr:MAG: polysaccharide deacetylase [Pseudomonadota bacterium]